MHVISELLANNNVFLLCTDVQLFSMIAGWPWSEVVFDLRLHHIWIDKLLKERLWHKGNCQLHSSISVKLDGASYFEHNY